MTQSGTFNGSLLSNESETITVIDKVTNLYIMPTELFLGLLCQILNLVVLHGHQIRSLTYTIYLKALSINYLLSIFVAVPALMAKNGMAFPSSYPWVFYNAHLGAFFINWFLFSGNLIVAALAVEPLIAIVKPLSTLTLTSTRAYIVLTAIYICVAAVLTPLLAMFHVSTNLLKKLNFAVKACIYP